MPDIDRIHLASLERCKTPEVWSIELFEKFGVNVSPRTIRKKARETGEFFRFGREMLLSPQQLEKLWGVEI